MADLLLGRFARTVVHYSLELRPGDLFLIRTSTLAEPLLREVYREALEAGAVVSTRISFDGQEDAFYVAASDEALETVSPIERYEMETLDARLMIFAPFNTRATSAADPARMSRFTRAQSELVRIHNTRAAAGELRWCSTLYPTNAQAQEAGMSLGEYEALVYGAMFLDQEDPIAAWRAFSAEQQKKVDYLDRVKTLRIVAPDTDLTLSVEGRKWMNSDGKRNFPSGEVFTGPIEDSANGTIRFTYPAVRGGREVEDVRLWFEQGKVVRASASRGQEYLEAMLDSDAGARFLGEVAMGNNYSVERFTRHALFDEKIGGTCHLAVGSSYPDTGGRNESALHWDMVCDLRKGGAIYADGELIHKDGQWRI